MVVKNKKTNTATYALIGAAAVGTYLLFKKGNKPAPPPLPPIGKANLYGKITSGGQPVIGASITVDSITRSISDASGDYTVTDLELGIAQVQCSKIGYVTATNSVTLVSGNNRDDIVLTRELQAILLVENLQISPAYPLVGSQVQIAVIGTTDVSGTYSLSLKVNGAVTQTKGIVITAGETKLITFTYSPANTGIYAVQVGSLTGRFETVEGLLCYNDGPLFATQAELDAHIRSTHTGLAGSAPLLINKISWGSNSIGRSGQRLVAGGMYLLDNKQTPQPYSSVSVEFQVFNLWMWFAASDFPEITVSTNIFIGKFGDIGASPFRTTIGSAGTYPLMLSAGGTLPGRIGDSGKTFTMTVPPYADLAANMQPGLYDILVSVSMSGAGQGIFAYQPMSSFGYVILNAWKVG